MTCLCSAGVNVFDTADSYGTGNGGGDLVTRPFIHTLIWSSVHSFTPSMSPHAALTRLFQAFSLVTAVVYPKYPKCIPKVPKVYPELPTTLVYTSQLNV